MPVGWFCEDLNSVSVCVVILNFKISENLKAYLISLVITDKVLSHFKPGSSSVNEVDKGRVTMRNKCGNGHRTPSTVLGILYVFTAL